MNKKIFSYLAIFVFAFFIANANFSAKVFAEPDPHSQITGAGGTDGNPNTEITDPNSRLQKIKIDENEKSENDLTEPKTDSENLENNNQGNVGTVGDGQNNLNKEQKKQKPIENAKPTEEDQQKKAVEEISAWLEPTGEYTGIMTVGLPFAFLILSVVAAYIFSSSKVDKREFQRHLSERKNSGFNESEIIERQSAEINELRQAVRRLESQIENANNRRVEDFPRQNSRIENSFVGISPANSNSQNFLQEFNKLSNFQGFEFTEAKRNFIQMFNVKTFSCKNYEERIRNPKLQPIFGIDSTPVDGGFLAHQIGNDLYEVVPNLKVYANEHHVQATMRDFFDSNFTPGQTYRNISVIKPALVTAAWQVKSKGELRLS